MRLLATDLDGTLLDSNGLVSTKNFDALQKAKESGAQIVICTGRPPESAVKFATDIGLNTPGNYCICYNGAATVDLHTKCILHTLTLSQPDVAVLLNLLNEGGHTAIGYSQNESYANISNALIQTYIEHLGIPLTIERHFDQLDPRFYKVMMVDNDRDTLEQFRLSLQNWAMNKICMIYTSPILLEFMDINASKGNALTKLANLLQIPCSDIIAVGDNFNDVSMIEAAGCGIAVANAESAVKQKANFVTASDNDHDAIDEVVTRFLLQ